MAPRAVWSATDDGTLIATLGDQKANGRMTSNSSWHSDAWVAAEKALEDSEKASGGAKKTSSSCHHRWTNLKKEWNIVKNLRGMSGMGWDQEKGVVTASDDVWDKLLEAHPNYRKWRTASFPHYDLMDDLVNGTVATGQTAFHPSAPPPPTTNTATQHDTQPSSEGEDNNHEESPAAPAPTPLKRRVSALENDLSASSRKKKKISPAAEGMSSMATAIMHLGDRLGGPANASPERRREAIQLILKDGELDSDDEVDAFQLIRQDSRVADTVLAITPKAKRSRYIRVELSNARTGN
ncbi:hypothetical protein H1R20_g9141, partial [Candolleomyces eurysporus]